MNQGYGILVFFCVLWAFQQAKGNVSVFYFHPPVLEIEGPTIDIPSNSTLTVNCTGKAPVFWKLPVKNDDFRNDSRISIHNSIDAVQTINKYRTSLTITDIAFTESGTYSCYYEGTTDFGFRDNVTSVYVFVNDPEHLFLERSVKVHPLVLVQQNKRTIIACLPTSSSINVTLWKLETEKDGGEMVPVGMDVVFDPTEGFVLFYPTVYFTGAFQCRASLGKREQHINFTLVYFPDTLRNPQPYINTSEALHPVMNGSFTLKCTVEVDVGTRVFFDWSYPNKDNPRINETMASSKTKTSETTGYVHQVVTSYLIVKNATLSDSGDYRCSVTDHSKKMGSYNVTVVVYAFRPPTHVNFTSDMDLSKPVVYQAGKKVKFVITVKAFPSMSDVELYWMKDGEPLLADSRYRRKTTGNIVKLEIEKLDVSDAGTYTLVGKTSDTENNISIILDVKAKPSVTVKNTKIFYLVGGKYNLECIARAYPTNFILWWRWKPCKEIQNCNFGDPNRNWTDVEPRNQSPNQEHISIDDRKISNGENTRFFSSILHVTANMSGHYQCMASNVEGDDNQIIPFIVTDAVNGFEVSASETEPVAQDKVVLTCRANTRDYSEVHWKRNNGNISQDLINSYDSSIFNESTDYSHSSVITFNRIHVNQSDDYECIAGLNNANRTDSQKITLRVKKIIKPVLNQTNMQGKVLPVSPGTQQELFCYASGVPEPTIFWEKDGLPFDVSNMSGVELTDKNQRIVIKRVLDKDSGFYECLIQNKGGKVTANITLNVLAENKVYLKNTLSKNEIAIIVVIIIVGVAFFILVSFFCVRVRADMKEKEELTFLSQNAFERGYVDILNPSLPLVEQIDLLPYNHQFEFPKERLKLGKTLGQGAFGRVVKAEAIGLVNGEASTTVAVKMLKETANNEQRKALIAELKILIHLGKHLNIVNLLGAVTKNIRKGELMVIVEYCCFGNLRHYLLKHKGSYVNQLNPMTGELDPECALNDLGFEEHHNKPLNYVNIFGMGMDNPSYGRQILHYAELMHSVNNSDSGVESSSLPSAPLSTETYSIDTVIPVKRPRAVWTVQNEESTKQRFVTTRNLLVYSFQCARGMEYLASKKLIHRDLAARNVLLASNNVVKICDFGLTKDGYNYVKKKDDGGLLPVKWLAIESIRHKVFTTKSDVWSFGVLLWEIFTLGGNPYPGVEFNYEFVKKLEDGYRMEKPDLAPRSIYHMMQSCWLDEPTQRPDFTLLSEKIGLLLETGVRKYYVELNAPYSVMNEEYLNNNDYLQMGKQNNEENYTKMDDTKENGKPQRYTYDNIPFVRPIDNSLIPKLPMEVVPMIQFDSPMHSQINDNVNNHQQHQQHQKILKSFSLEGNINQPQSHKESNYEEQEEDLPFPKQRSSWDMDMHHRYVNGDWCSMPLLYRTTNQHEIL